MIKNIIASVVTALLVSLFVVGLVGGNQSVPKSGGVTNYDAIEAESLAIGDNCDNEDLTCAGSNITQILTGTGALIYSNSSVVASTTSPFDIAVTGVVSTDKVFVQTATTTANGAGWLITGASASSTAGFITVRVANNSGATGNIPRNIASSTPYLILR